MTTTAKDRYREKRILQLMNRCVHFSGIQHETCRAGVSYASVKDESTRPYKWPCFRDEGAVTECGVAKYPTRDEAEAEREESEKRIQQVLVARAAIIEHAAGKRGISGEIACPVCTSGRLRFSIASVNGHVHARCSTNDCIAFME